MGSQRRWGTRCGVPATTTGLLSTPAHASLYCCPLRRDGGNADLRRRQRVEEEQADDQQQNDKCMETTRLEHQRNNNEYKPFCYLMANRWTYTSMKTNDERRLQEPIIYDPEDYLEDNYATPCNERWLA